MKNLALFVILSTLVLACSGRLSTETNSSSVAAGGIANAKNIERIAQSSTLSSLVETYPAALKQPLATWGNFSYAGGFRLPASKQTIGPVDFRYGGNRGSIGIAQDRTKMFVGAYRTPGGNGMPGWAQIRIPVIDPTDTFEEMPIAISIQGISEVWRSVNTPKGEKKNRSMHCIEYDGMLIGTMVHNYDASAKQSHMLWRVDNASDLAKGKIQGLYDLEGAYYASGWIAEVPEEWQSLVGYSHLMGNAHNFSISGRASIGPTFFGVDLNQVTAHVVKEPIQTDEYMNYPQNQSKSLFRTKYPHLVEVESNAWNTTDAITYTDAHYNVKIRPHEENFPPSHIDYPDQGPALGNDIWLVGTRAGLGFIIPGTRTYAVFGKVDGIEHGLGYRIVNNIGQKSSGPAPYDHGDRSNFHWFFDMRDIIEVRNGKKKPFELLPYSYGPISLAFEYPEGSKNVAGSGFIFGGTFDPENMRVYFALRNYDRHKPLILAYDISIGE